MVMKVNLTVPVEPLDYVDISKMFFFRLNSVHVSSLREKKKGKSPFPRFSREALPVLLKHFGDIFFGFAK